MKRCVSGIPVFAFILFITFAGSVSAQDADAMEDISFDNPEGIHCVVKAGAAGPVGIPLKKVSSTAVDDGTVIFTANGDKNQICTFTGKAMKSFAQADALELVLPHAPGVTNAYIAVTSGEAGQ